jgi:CDGSH-type Zn-finger protein
MAAPSRPGEQRPTRVTLTEGGPFLVEGPVELELPDGSRVTSERPVVALCACRRTKRYPFCDTSHRRKARPGRDRTDADQAPGQAADGVAGASSADAPADHDRTR